MKSFDFIIFLVIAGFMLLKGLKAYAEQQQNRPGSGSSTPPAPSRPESAKPRENEGEEWMPWEPFPEPGTKPRAEEANAPAPPPVFAAGESRPAPPVIRRPETAMPAGPRVFHREKPPLTHEPPPTLPAPTRASPFGEQQVGPMASRHNVKASQAAREPDEEPRAQIATLPGLPAEIEASVELPSQTRERPLLTQAQAGAMKIIRVTRRSDTLRPLIFINRDRKILRQAVILSEILGRPRVFDL